MKQYDGIQWFLFFRDLSGVCGCFFHVYRFSQFHLLSSVHGLVSIHALVFWKIVVQKHVRCIVSHPIDPNRIELNQTITKENTNTRIRRSDQFNCKKGRKKNHFPNVIGSMRENCYLERHPSNEKNCTELFGIAVSVCVFVLTFQCVKVRLKAVKTNHINQLGSWHVHIVAKNMGFCYGCCWYQCLFALWKKDEFFFQRQTWMDLIYPWGKVTDTTTTLRKLDSIPFSNSLYSQLPPSCVFIFGKQCVVHERRTPAQTRKKRETVISFGIDACVFVRGALSAYGGVFIFTIKCGQQECYDQMSFRGYE